MILYHGSYIVVQKPDLRKSAIGKDFGAGFYLTSDHEQAKSFIKTSTLKAIRMKAIPPECSQGAVSIFEFDESAPLRVFRFETTNAKWLQFIAANRRPNIFKGNKGKQILAEFDNYDIIVGKIADDNTNKTLTAYLSGVYGQPDSDEAINDTIHRLYPERLKNQFCFLTDRAINALTFKEVEYYDINDTRCIR